MIEIKIETNNDVFKSNYSQAVNYVIMQVQNIADRIDHKKITIPVAFKLWDENGNSIGSVKFTK